MTTNSRDARNRRRGYLEALGDIADKMETEGVDGVLEWLKNNYYDTLSRQEIEKRTQRLSSGQKSAREVGTEVHKAAEEFVEVVLREKELAKPTPATKKVKKGPVSASLPISREKVAEWTLFCQSLPNGTVLPTLKDFVSGDFQKKLSS